LWVNRRKQEQLGIPVGTASGEAEESGVVLRLLQKLGDDFCCGYRERIEEVKNPTSNVRSTG
jgi:hypothetical protein